MIAGVDEAGRGPVLGPLVVGGVAVEDDGALKDLGVRDSKKLTAKRRCELEIEIRKVAKAEVVVIPADEIDTLRAEMSLNRIEAKLFATVIERLGGDTPWEIFVDSADIDEEKFGRLILTELSNKPRIVSKHKADESFPVVSAASIVAKVRRDAEIKNIENEIGRRIGSGYPADPVTVNFIESWLREKGDFPPHTRRSWATSINMQKRLLDKTRGTSLGDWAVCTDGDERK